MTRSPALLCLVAGLALPGCLWLRPEREVDPLAAPLQQVDTAWRGRGMTGLDPVGALLTTLLATAPTDPRVLWRVARLHWLAGFLAEERVAAQTEWETGREFALACLAADPDVAAGFRQNGWLLADPAISSTSPAQRPCLLWGAANGLALVEARGAGGALDAEGACAMLDRATTGVGPSDPGLIDWELGTCAWWLTGDVALARESWGKAIASGNPLFALAPHAHDNPATEVAAGPEYGLEAARYAALTPAR